MFIRLLWCIIQNAITSRASATFHMKQNEWSMVNVNQETANKQIWAKRIYINIVHWNVNWPLYDDAVYQSGHTAATNKKKSIKRFHFSSFFRLTA